ncbi:unnamed protein product [Moneuplotes crassus]|uniref:Uncharacterized protein n=1 Tax=Euplotes crassus TaxID=5936 RepID=A0AAD1UI69_EUPCR|nr:unnamed protein product [Moneuplotes crassus]
MASSAIEDSPNVGNSVGFTKASLSLVVLKSFPLQESKEIISIFYFNCINCLNKLLFK